MSEQFLLEEEIDEELIEILEKESPSLCLEEVEKALILIKKIQKENVLQRKFVPKKKIMKIFCFEEDHSIALKLLKTL